MFVLGGKTFNFQISKTVTNIKMNDIGKKILFKLNFFIDTLIIY